MSDVWVVVLAPAPLEAFLIWTACWLALDSLDQRRTVRAAATATRNPRPDDGTAHA